MNVAASSRFPRPSSQVAASREVPPGRRHLQSFTSVTGQPIPSDLRRVALK